MEREQSSEKGAFLRRTLGRPSYITFWVGEVGIQVANGNYLDR
jgi:hypothetical protein